MLEEHVAGLGRYVAHKLIALVLLLLLLFAVRFEDVLFESGVMLPDYTLDLAECSRF